VNIKEIKEMINLMNDNGLVELEIEKDGSRIRLKKSGAQIDAFVANSQTADKENILPRVLSRQESAEPIERTVAKTVEIKAPMVGTFYRAPSPGAPSFVEIGQVIEPGQVICIIEAMKLMNEIKSEIKGKITEILVDTVEPVEFGQPMFIIEPL
jgi:oxaloacetate decarboxylase alpha subunit